MKYVAIRHVNDMGPKLYYFNCKFDHVQKGDLVCVMTKRGPQLGTVQYIFGNKILAESNRGGIITKDVIAIIDATDVLEKENKRKRFIQLQNALKNAVMSNWENYLLSLIVAEDKYSEMTGEYFRLKKEFEE